MVLLENIIQFLKKISIILAIGTAPLYFVLMLLASVIVIMRYFFNISFTWMQELVFYMHSFLFLIFMSYTYCKDSHVRLDILYRNYSNKFKNIINILGILLFLAPLIYAFYTYNIQYIKTSWLIKEASAESGGIPYTYVFKSFMLIMPTLLLLEGTAQLLMNIRDLINVKNKELNQNSI